MSTVFYGILSHPVLFGLVVLFICPLVLFSMDRIDYHFIRGADRPTPYMGFWNVVLFDWFGLPLAAYLSAEFFHEAGGVFILKNYSFLNTYLIAAGVLLGVGHTVRAVLDVCNERANPNWSLSGKGIGVNIAGFYHMVVFSVLASYFICFAVKGGIFIYSRMGETGISTPAIICYAFSIGLVLSTIPINFMLDENRRVPRPNELFN